MGHLNAVGPQISGEGTHCPIQPGREAVGQCIGRPEEDWQAIAADPASWPIYTADATDTPKRFAASRTVKPSFNAAATRIRKSSESGRTIAAGLLPSDYLESRQLRLGEGRS